MSKKPKRCKWTGQPHCMYYDHANAVFGCNLKPFECCDGVPDRDIPGNTFRGEDGERSAVSSCQLTTMGFLSKEGYLKEVINDGCRL